MRTFLNSASSKSVTDSLLHSQRTGSLESCTFFGILVSPLVHEAHTASSPSSSALQIPTERPPPQPFQLCRRSRCAPQEQRWLPVTNFTSQQCCFKGARLELVQVYLKSWKKLCRSSHKTHGRLVDGICEHHAARLLSSSVDKLKTKKTKV